MDLNNTEVLLCNCGDTMPLDSKKIGVGCNSKKNPKIFNSLCTTQTEFFETALNNAKESKKSLAVACTQQVKTFTDIAEESNNEIPYFFNIRETAGWSKSAKKASAKISSLILDATNNTFSTSTARGITFHSAGRCLIYGKSEAALKVAEDLSEFLGVNALLSEAEDIIPPKNDNFNVISGKISKLSGYFCNFKVIIDDFSEALPHSKETVLFSEKSQNVSSECDIFIDLTGEEPLISSFEKRDGYFKVDPKDKLGIEQLILEAQSKIGEFEKPIYVHFDESLCAHSRNKISGCSNCLDVCPANAINSNGDTVQIDTSICGGCGLCGSVCPSGAAKVIWPSVDKLLNRLSSITENYMNIEKKKPRLLIHDHNHGNGLLSYLSRIYDGLPYDVIPIEMHSTGRCGHDLLIGATALGFSEIFILTDPAKYSDNLVIKEQVKIANALLDGINIKSDEKFTVIETVDPEEFNSLINIKNKTYEYEHSPFIAAGTNKSITRTALKGLSNANNFKGEVISLPDNSPYGRLDINDENCTLCLACVSACPAGALQDNPETPQLLFREDACIQCGICVKTCPEKVISLVPQFSLSDKSLSNEIINEDEPFPCTTCGKIFGTKKSIESIKNRLTQHSMFLSEERLNLILMCEDCRVENQFKQDEKIIDVPERAKPRTTDDYH